MHAGVRAEPFLKWVGGKRALLDEILRFIPARIGTYYEPFVGGGAVFFALAAEGRRFRRAVLSDANRELIRCYKAIRDDVDAVIDELGDHRYERGHYYKVRELNPGKLPAARAAARLIYLNRSGFNGLYRVNSRGGFNVPFGRHKNPLICNPDRLKAAAAALDDVDIRHGDFADVVSRATSRDFVYFDPPYVPVSVTSSFTRYARKDFRQADQERLAATLRDLGRRQIPALLSNSDCAVTRDLYDGLPLHEVSVRRPVNRDATKRGAVPELLVRSFAYALDKRKAGSVMRSRPPPPGKPGLSLPAPARNPVASRDSNRT